MKQCNITEEEWKEYKECDKIPIYANDEECKNCKWYQEVYQTGKYLNYYNKRDIYESL